MKKENRTYADRREYLIRAVTERRRKLKQMIIDAKGGSCFVCGYNRCTAALDLHHIDETKKSFGFAEGGITRSQKALFSEAEKCILLCANCHREFHSGKIFVNQEGDSSFSVVLAKSTQI